MKSLTIGMVGILVLASVLIIGMPTHRSGMGWNNKMPVRYESYKITESMLKVMEDKMGFRDPHKNYNVIIDGHGTGLAPPTKEEYNFILKHATYVKGVKGYRSKGSVDLSKTPYFPPIGNQGQQGSCAAWATSYYDNTYHQAKVHNWTDLNDNYHHIMSPAWTYNKVNGGADQGSTFLGNYELMETIGDASLATMPYSDSDYVSWGSEAAWREAPIGRIQGIQITDVKNIDVIKSWLDQGYLVTFAINADVLGDKGNEAFADGNYIVSSKEYKNYVGQPNHAQTIVGYDDSITDDGDVGAFRIVNSWGGNWGDHGFYWMTYNAFKMLSWNYTYRIVGSSPNHPHLLGAWKFSHTGPRDVKVNVGIGTVSNPINNRTLYLDGGYYKFPEFMAVDFTDYYSNWKSNHNISFFLNISENETGTGHSVISNFWIEYYPGKYTVGMPYRESFPSNDTPAETPTAVYNRLIILKNLSDLEISKEDIKVNTNLPVGTHAQILITVHNIGNISANNVSASVYFDKVITYYKIETLFFGNISVGGKITRSFEWTVPTTIGKHKIIVVVDDSHQVPELNESNNKASINIMIFKQPDAPYLMASRGNGFVNLTWTMPNDGGAPIQKYTLYRNGVKYKYFNNDTFQYIDKNVNMTKTYTYYITATNLAGESKPSNEVNVSWNVPGAPSNVHIYKGILYVFLTWGAPIYNGGANVTEYRVYRGTDPNTTSLIATIPVDNSTSENKSKITYWYNDTNVEDHVTYYYYVVAVNPVGEGNKSKVLGVTLNYDLEPPHINILSPKNNSVITNKVITIKWSVTDNVGVKSIEIKIDNGKWKTLNNNTTSYTVKNITVGVHIIYLKANDTSGNVAIKYIKINVKENIPGSNSQSSNIFGIPTAVVLGSSVAIVILILIVVIAVALKRRHKSTGEENVESDGNSEEETNQEAMDKDENIENNESSEE